MFGPTLRLTSLRAELRLIVVLLIAVIGESGRVRADESTARSGFYETAPDTVPTGWDRSSISPAYAEPPGYPFDPSSDAIPFDCECDESQELTRLPPDIVEPSAARGESLLGDSSRAPLRARWSWLPSSGLQNGPGRVSIQDLQLDLAFPLRIESDGIWLGLAGIQTLGVDMNGVPTSVSPPLPDRFWDIELGVMRIKRWESGKVSGAMVRVGSPSDRPYAALRDVTVSCLAFLQVPRDDRDAWEFSLFYSPTGQIVFPIPGIAYRWRPSERFQAQIGIPASFVYRPTDEWTLRGAYRPLNQVQLEASRKLDEHWDVFGRFDTISEAFFQSEREEKQERTYFFDQRLALGVRRRLMQGWSVEANVAYVFDRKIFEAESFSRDRQHVMALDPTVAGGLSLSWER